MISMIRLAKVEREAERARIMRHIGVGDRVCSLETLSHKDLLFMVDHAVYHLEKAGYKLDAELVEELQRRFEGWRQAQKAAESTRQ